MRASPGQVAMDLGPAKLVITPLEAWQWREAAAALAGPAGLCLELLPLAQPNWQGVALTGQPAPPADPEHLALLPAAVLPLLLQVLCPPWLSHREAAQLEELTDYLRALADYPGLDCRDCRDQEARGEGAPRCGQCPRPQAPGHSLAALALHPLLASAGAAARAGLWPRGLSPRQERLLAMRLALMDRLPPPREPGLPGP